MHIVFFINIFPHISRIFGNQCSSHIPEEQCPHLFLFYSATQNETPSVVIVEI